MSCCPEGQIIGKTRRFFTKTMVPWTPLTVSIVDKSSFGKCHGVS